MTIQEFLNTETDLFYQREPDAQWSFLDAVMVSDVKLSGREPGAAFETPDQGGKNQFEIQGFLPGSLILPGFTCQRPWRELNRLWQLTQEGPVSFRLNAAKTGSPTDSANYDSAIIFVQGDVTSPTSDQGKALQSGEAARTLTGMTVQALRGYELQPLGNWARQTQATTEPANGVAFWDKVKTGLLHRRDGQYGIITLDAGAAATADIMWTADYGATWTAGGADPFDVNAEDAIFPICVDLPQTLQRRAIVFNGVTNAGANSECAYCDDGTGAAWTTVDIGGTNAWFITAAIKVHDGLILAGDDQGNVYYSKDKAATWTIGSYGGTNDVRGFAVDPTNGRIWAVGDGTEFYYSEDEGVTWTSAGALSGAGGKKGVAVNHFGYVFVIDGTTLKMTKTQAAGGFTTVTVTAEAVTALLAIQFDKHGYTGIIAVDDAGADDRIFRTEDGGITWIAQTTGTANTGYNDAVLVNPNLAFIAGDVVATTWAEKLFGDGQGS